VEELHHDERRTLRGGAEIEDVDDARMADPRRRLGLHLESGQGRRIGGAGRREHLDRDRPLDAQVHGADHQHEAMSRRNAGRDLHRAVDLAAERRSGGLTVRASP
jgi:hypothetical protein